MPLEIERKFLLKDDSWKQSATGVYYKQGYLNQSAERTVRVRIIESSAYLTVKGKTKGMARAEYEYAIPLADAQEMLDNLCERPLIEKYRYKVEFEGFIWEIDEFLGENAGLTVAEVELPDLNTQPPIPAWIGEEVTEDARYYNANLSRNPYKRW
jgi:CYTH domain-containing protein